MTDRGKEAPKPTPIAELKVERIPLGPRQESALDRTNRARFVLKGHTH